MVIDPVVGDEGPAAVAQVTTGGPAPRRSAAAVLVRGGSWNALAQFAPLATNIVLTPFILSGLGLTRFGLFVLAVTISTFLGAFDGGIGASAQRYFAVQAGTDDRAATTRLLTTLVALVTLLGCVLFLVLFLTGPLLLRVLDVPAELLPEGEFLLRTLAVLVGFGLLQNLFGAVLNARQRFALTSMARVGTYAVYAVGAVIAVQQDFGLRGLALTLVAQAVLNALIIVPAACRYLSWSDVRLLSWADLKEFLRYAATVQVTGLMGLIILQADILIVGAFLSVRTVGVYTVGGTFASQLRTVPLNVLAPAQSLLARTFGERGESGARWQFERLQRLWVQGTSGWCAVGVVAAYFGVVAWLGEEFHTSALVASVLLAGQMVNLWTGMLTVWLRVVGRPELEARYGVVGVGLNVVLTLALVVPFGLLGVVVATTAGQVIGSLYLLRLVRRRYAADLPDFLRAVPVAPVLVAALTTLALELLARPLLPTGPLGLLAAGAVAAPALAVYLAALMGPRAAWQLVATAVRTRRLTLPS